MAKEIKTKEKPFIRSIYNLGDFNDDEVNNEPSMTDPSQDEPIERLVERMMRGEIIGHGVPQFDTSSEDMTPEQMFSMQSEIKKDGFDLADAGSIKNRAEHAARRLKEASKPSVPPQPEKSKEEAPAPQKDGK